MELFKIFGTIAIKGVEETNKSIEQTGQKSAEAASKMKGVGSSSDTLKNKMKVLSAQYNDSKKKVADLTTEFNKTVKTQGANSEAAQKLAKDLDKAEKESADLKKQLDELSKSGDKSGNSLSKAGSNIGKAFSTIGKVGIAAVGAAATAIGALGKQSIESYAEYEQLVGGVETLFGGSKDAVISYAKDAFKTAGMSANQYMETVTGFSASLLQSLDGDTARATELSNVAITDMSDNANKMGTSIESIQNAYQGFAKQNYTMLDNLKLGYGGTKSEMERLIADANELRKEQGLSADLTIEKYSDVIEAIHTVQDEMGIAGATQQEAYTTIQGSLGMLKGAWSNFLTGMSEDTQDFDALLGGVVDSFVTVTDNLVPRIAMMLPRLVAGLTSLVTSLTPYIEPLLNQLLPALITGATGLLTGLSSVLTSIAQSDLITNLVTSIAGAIPELLTSGGTLLMAIITGIGQNAGMILTTGLDLIKKLGLGINNALPEISARLPGIIGTIVGFLISAIPQLIDTGVTLITSLLDNLPTITSNLLSKLPELISGIVSGLVEAIPQIVDAGVTLLSSLVDNLPFIIQAIVQNLPQIITSIVGALLSLTGELTSAGIQLFSALLTNIPEILIELTKGIFELVAGIVQAFADKWEDIKQAGRDMIQAVLDGLVAAWENVVSWFEGVWDKLFGKRSVDIEANVSGGGDGASGVDGSHASGLDFVPFDGYRAELHKGEMVVTAKQAQALREGSYVSNGGEIAGLLTNILEALQTQKETVLSVNNREFGRLVRGCV